MEISIGKMQVIKRNGTYEEVSFDKVTKRNTILCDRLNIKRINPTFVAQKAISGIKNNITTHEIDHYTSVICADKISEDPEYDKLGVGICVSRLHKMTSSNYKDVINYLYNNIDKDGQSNPLITKEFYDYVLEHVDRIQEALDKNYMNDYNFSYFGFKTLEKSYLNRVKWFQNKYYENGIIVERPQHLWMRVAIELNDNIDDVISTYNGLSNKYFIFGSPTLFNAGSPTFQGSSCFLLYMGDSIETILDTIKKIGLISKRAGGIGVCLSDIRAKGSLIRGTNGHSSGIVPLIQMLNWEARYINQGGKRLGAIAVYVEPWHADIWQYCELRLNRGKEEERARDIFLALWNNDLFMERVENNELWSLMCPDECPGLTNVYGDEFKELYTRYEKEKKYKRQVNATDLWHHILTSQIETGMPYMLYKDHVNRKSNQSNIGVIKCSNLCSEIVQYTSNDETAVCNLSSLCLPRFMENGEFNYEKLIEMTKIVVHNLNNVIDKNKYPTPDAKTSNMKHRPIGIGVQGLADVYYMMRIPFDSDEARIVNRKIFETIYYGALLKSVELAKKYGKYDTFDGSPFSKGLTQIQLWNKEDSLLMDYDWASLISDLKEYGARNSLLTTIMPTASTSNIMGNTEACEPMTANIYTRQTSAGEYTILNKFMVEHLIELNLWDNDMRKEILHDKGSIQNIRRIPQHVRNIYKTSFEVKNRSILTQSAERGPFIDQSQSQNLFCKTPDFGMLTSAHFFGWKNGLKTGMYYLRIQISGSDTFGIDTDEKNKIRQRKIEDEKNNNFEGSCEGGLCGA